VSLDPEDEYPRWQFWADVAIVTVIFVVIVGMVFL